MLSAIRPLSESVSVAGSGVELTDMPHYKIGEVLARIATEDALARNLRPLRAGRERRPAAGSGLATTQEATNPADKTVMQNRRNFYRILHVQPDAPPEVIRTSYRTLMQRLKMHPDLGGDHWQAALVNEAFATLRDPEKRAAYDRMLAGSPAGPPKDRAPGAGPRPATAAPDAPPPPPAAAVQAATPAWPACRAARATNACAFCGESQSAQDAMEPAAVCWRCDSPLFPTAKHRRETGSGRALDRMPRSIAVTIHLSGSGPQAFGVTTEDISINGARFTSAVELAAGHLLKLDCAFCTAVGIVRHAQVEPESRPPRWHIGVEFATLLIKQPRGAFVSTRV